jgi:Na+/H+-translocating membrane pyrophosphatase
MSNYQLNLFFLSERVRLNTLLGGVALIITSFSIMFLLRNWHSDAGFIVGMLVLFGGGYAGYKRYKKAIIVPSLVSITDAELSVRNLLNDQTLLTVAYATIASYRYQSFNGTEELRLTLRNTGRVSVKANSTLANVGDFASMAQDFERQIVAMTAAMEVGQLASGGEQADSAIRTVREKSFFEKPVSTICLVVFTAMLVLVAKQLITGTLPFKGIFLVVGGIYLSYLAAWLAASKQRKQPL